MEDLTYYGRMDGELLGNQTLGVLCMELAFRKVLEKNELLFEEQREQTLKSLREMFKHDFDGMRRSIEELKNRVKELEKKKKK